MPGWEMTDDQIWPLVTFIGRLPHLSDQQIEKLKGEAGDAHTH